MGDGFMMWVLLKTDLDFLSRVGVWVHGQNLGLPPAAEGFEFGVWGSVFEVWVLGVAGLGFGVWGLVFGVSGFGFWVLGFGF